MLIHHGSRIAVVLLLTGVGLTAAEPEKKADEKPALPTPAAFQALLEDPEAFAKLQASARAQAARRQAVIGKLGAPVDPGAAAAGQRVAIDDVTGQLRPPTEAEARALQPVTAAADGAAKQPQVIFLPGGVVVATVPAQFRTMLVARKTADGEVEITERQVETSAPAREEK